MVTVTSLDISQKGSLKEIQVSDRIFTNVRPPHQANPESLVFISSLESYEQAKAAGAKGFVAVLKIGAELEGIIDAEVCLWLTPHINQAMSQILKLFDRHALAPGQKIHPTAVIHPTATIGQNVTISPFVVVGETAFIEDQCVIGPHTVIEKNARIGSGSYLTAHVFVGAHCTVGKNCKIAPHVSIGADGFGFYTDAHFRHHKIAQIGTVVIEDDCEIGAHCAIDRATLTETRIGSGSKLDNFCHVAHNCTIGKNAILACGFWVAGSTQIGNNLMSAGTVQVNGHITIADNVVLTARTGVVNSISRPGVYGGFPEIPQKENVKVMVSQKHLPTMKRQLAKILAYLKLED